jgi:hypothetical protein
LKQVAAQDWVNKELISSELVVRMHYMNARIKQVPILYRQRKGFSRGLPPKKILGVILRVLWNTPKLKQSASNLRQKRA